MKLIPVNEAKLPELLEMLEKEPAEEIFLTNSSSSSASRKRLLHSPKSRAIKFSATEKTSTYSRRILTKNSLRWTRRF